DGCAVLHVLRDSMDEMPPPPDRGAPARARSRGAAPRHTGAHRAARPVVDRRDARGPALPLRGPRGLDGPGTSDRPDSFNTSTSFRERNDLTDSNDVRELIIIGGGPAGYTAALYSARADLEPLVIEGFAWGGQLMVTSDVENYPGYADGVMGPEMMADFRRQAERFGAE